MALCSTLAYVIVANVGRFTERASTAGFGSVRQEAKEKGYEGDPCQNCKQFTLVRNGTCLKCMSCGETSGCS